MWNWTRRGGASSCLSAVAVALLLVAVWLGQTLTYRYGRRVTRVADQADESGHRE